VGVVIPAAGRARRFGSGQNKIWIDLHGRSILQRTVSAFDNHPSVDSIVIVAGEHELEDVRAAVSDFNHVVAVVPGGDTRSQSVRNGLDALPEGTDIVLVHDAARPLLSAELIERIIELTVLHGAAVPGTPVSDTIKRVDAAGIVCGTIARFAALPDGVLQNELTAVQTPQGARLQQLVAAYNLYDYSVGEPTDEASLIEAAGGVVAVAMGESSNIKITRPEDVELAEMLLGSYQEEHRTGFGYDVHAFAPPEAGRTLYLGGVAIEHDRGLEGHSDADVVLHAICDALLGAAGLGDIGILFPNTDVAFKNISSLKLLGVVRDRLQEGRWRIGNIDATAVAEAPKLMPHRAAMAIAIGSELAISAELVSIKATTSEGMGFVGRREGIACWAVASLSRRRI